MYMRQVPRSLDVEHREQLALLGQLEHALARGNEAVVAPALARQLEHDVTRHFGFEEEQLFPRLDDAGDSGIVELLGEEHDAIRDVAEELLPLARALQQGPLDVAERADFRRLAVELIERMVAHIQKETMGLLPLLDDLLDDDTDRELAMAYAAG